MSCAKCCPVAKGFMGLALVGGLIALVVGISTTTATPTLPDAAPVATVAAPGSETFAADELNPTVTTRDWQQVNTRKRR